MRRNINLGNILVVVGLLGLMTTFFVPSWSSARIARVEGRAEETSRLLFDVARDLGGDPAAVREPMLERLRERCRDAEQPESDLPELESREGPGAVFGNRHYLFRAVLPPPPPGEEEAGPGPLEVYGWPRTVLPPGRTVFFFPVDGDAAYTRNLSAGYEGLGRAPRPGDGLLRGGLKASREGMSYRAANDERWILMRKDQG